MDRDGKESKGLLVFDSTNQAMKVEKALRSAEIQVTVIPTPVEITSDCGVALLLNKEYVSRATELLNSSGYEGYRMIYPYRRRKGSEEMLS